MHSYTTTETKARKETLNQRYRLSFARVYSPTLNKWINSKRLISTTLMREIFIREGRKRKRLKYIRCTFNLLNQMKAVTHKKVNEAKAIEFKAM